MNRFEDAMETIGQGIDELGEDVNEQDNPEVYEL